VISYAISDPSTLRFDERLESDLLRFASKADWLLYRDKGNSLYRENARRIARILPSLPKVELFLHDDWKLAAELGACGVHFSARGVEEIPAAAGQGLYIVASAHSIEEAESFAELGADAVTLSPIFESPGKGAPLGTDYLCRAVESLKLPVIALGGIVTPDAVEWVERCGAFGYASIRLFGG
jgi:thiamine-phosphate pyrophosphorylase